jgi:hypothetical protein
MDFKIFPKLLTDRITPLVDSLISQSQTVSIKGINILEGVVNFMRSYMNLRELDSKGYFSILIFKRHMTR